MHCTYVTDYITPQILRLLLRAGYTKLYKETFMTKAKLIHYHSVLHSELLKSTS